jgi:hypothetical protein
VLYFSAGELFGLLSPLAPWSASCCWPSSSLSADQQNKSSGNDQQIMSSAKHIYSIADNHAQTVQVCIDRLHQLHANQQLKRLAERLQKLATQAAQLGDGEKSKRQPGRSQN